MRLAIINIGTIVSGDWRAPLVQGDTIITAGAKIETVGVASGMEVEACDVVIDADGATAIPGLIDHFCPASMIRRRSRSSSPTRTLRWPTRSAASSACRCVCAISRSPR